MTFLEYVAERLMGPPASRSGRRLMWCCPFHCESNPSFCTLPPKHGNKDRYRCFACGVWGDEYDLMKLFYDNENFAQRRERMDAWREDHQRDDIVPTNLLTIRGEGSTERQVADSDDGLMEAWSGITDWIQQEDIGQETALRIVIEFEKQADQHGVSMKGLIGYWKEVWDWLQQPDPQHLECDDPDCEDRICRQARGLPALSAAEIRQMNSERKRERDAKIRRALRRTRA